MNRVLVALAAVGLLWAAQAVAQGAAKPDVAKLAVSLNRAATVIVPSLLLNW